MKTLVHFWVKGKEAKTGAGNSIFHRYSTFPRRSLNFRFNH